MRTLGGTYQRRAYLGDSRRNAKRYRLADRKACAHIALVAILGKACEGWGVMADERASVIELIRDVEPGHPYPWRFAITHKGVRHVFAGLPNQCATPGQALKRASD